MVEPFENRTKWSGFRMVRIIDIYAMTRWQPFCPNHLKTGQNSSVFKCHLVIAQKSIILTVWKPDKGQPFENRTCPVFRTALYCVILKRFDNPLVWSVFQRYQVFLLCFKIRILKSWSKWIDCIGKLSEWQIFLLPTFGVSLAHYLHSVGQTAIKIVRFNRFQ